MAMRRASTARRHHNGTKTAFPGWWFHPRAVLQQQPCVVVEWRTLRVGSSQYRFWQLQLRVGVTCDVPAAATMMYNGETVTCCICGLSPLEIAVGEASLGRARFHDCMRAHMPLCSSRVFDDDVVPYCILGYKIGLGSVWQ